MATGLFSSSSSRKRNGAFLDMPVEDQIGEIRNDIAALAKVLSARSTEAGKGLKARAGEAGEVAQDEIQALLANGEQMLADLRSRYAGTEKQVRTAVREHPIATLGVVAVLGLVAAALLRR